MSSTNTVTPPPRSGTWADLPTFTRQGVQDRPGLPLTCVTGTFRKAPDGTLPETPFEYTYDYHHYNLSAGEDVQTANDRYDAMIISQGYSEVLSKVEGQDVRTFYAHNVEEERKLLETMMGPQHDSNPSLPDEQDGQKKGGDEQTAKIVDTDIRHFEEGDAKGNGSHSEYEFV